MASKFSLQSLLLIVSMAAIVTGVVAGIGRYYNNRAAKEQALLDVLRQNAYVFAESEDSALPGCRFCLTWLFGEKAWRQTFACRVTLVKPNANVDIVTDALSQLRLRHLELEWGKLDGSHIANIASIRTLETLCIVYSELPDSSLRSFKSLPRLREVDLSSSTVGDKGVVLLSQCGQLESVHLNFTDVTDRGVAAVSTLPHLKILSLEGTKLSEDGVCSLRETNIEQLSLMETHPDPECAACIAQMVHLRRLAVPATFGDQELEVISRLARIEDLYLDHSEVTSRGLIHLSKMPKLKFISLWETDAFHRPGPEIYRFRHIDIRPWPPSYMDDRAKQHFPWLQGRPAADHGARG